MMDYLVRHYRSEKAPTFLFYLVHRFWFGWKLHSVSWKRVCHRSGRCWFHVEIIWTPDQRFFAVEDQKTGRITYHAAYGCFGVLGGLRMLWFYLTSRRLRSPPPYEDGSRCKVLPWAGFDYLSGEGL